MVLEAGESIMGRNGREGWTRARVRETVPWRVRVRERMGVRVKGVQPA